jgi:hypothetical protein
MSHIIYGVTGAGKWKQTSPQWVRNLVFILVHGLAVAAHGGKPIEKPGQRTG